MAVDGQGYGDFPSVLLQELHDPKNRPHTDNLFRHLGKGGDMGFLHPVIVTVNAGVKGGKGDGQGHDQQVGLAAGL